MKTHGLITAIILGNLLAITFFLIHYTNATYPLVGNDYKLFIPRLIDSHLFYKVNGLAIEWYTPSFGGGLPAYPNPLQMQFSFPQLFTWFVNPYLAILVSAGLYIAIGFLVCYSLLQDVLGFKPFSSILGASFFVANGFFIERLIVGHADKITGPLIVIPLFALLDRKLPAWLAGALIALTGAILVNSGGVYIGVLCLFTLLVALPIIYLLKPDLFNWRKMVPAVLWGAGLTIMLCGSKLYAINALMQTFPRIVHDRYATDWLSSIWGLILQLIGVMTSLPALNLIGKNSLVFVVRLAKWTGSPYGFWELDSSISPVLTLLLAIGIWKTVLRKPKIEKAGFFRKALGVTLLLLSIVLVAQFATARGFFFNILKNLPILESIRTNTRFAAAFILPLAILGAKIFENLSASISHRKGTILFGLLNVLSLAALWFYYLLPMKAQGRTYDVQSILDTYDKVQAGEVFPVKRIVPDMNDYEVFEGQASNTSHHYDPLYGETSFYPLVHEGSIFDIQNGYYNMTDPTGYVYPQVNNSKLFSKIPVADYQKLVDFVNRRQSDWNLPLFQKILDWIAGLTFVPTILAIILYQIRKWIQTRISN